MQSDKGFAPAQFFFRQELACHYKQDGLIKKHLLADLTSFLDEEAFASVKMGWDETGLFWDIVVQTEKVSVSYPDIEAGDSIELFIDTRNVVQAKTTHRFCHHFYFLPEAIEGHTKGEITRFRTDESHPLCDADLLECEIEKKQKQYKAAIFIPSRCLVGYVGERGARIGFCYRINRFQKHSQHFNLSSQHVRLEYVPYLWSTVHLQ